MIVVFGLNYIDIPALDSFYNGEYKLTSVAEWERAIMYCMSMVLAHSTPNKAQ